MKTKYRTGEKALTPGQVDTFLSVIDNITHEGLFRLAITAGLRRDDIIRVKQSDFYPDENKLLYTEKKKKNRIREIYLPDSTVKTLKQICNVYSSETYLFPGRSNGHISSKTAYNLFQKYLKRAGIENKPFHALRATCIKLCQAKGWTPEQTAEHVGDKISTTQEHYLTPSKAEMQETAKEKNLL